MVTNVVQNKSCYKAKNMVNNVERYLIHICGCLCLRDFTTPGTRSLSSALMFGILQHPPTISNHPWPNTFHTIPHKSPSSRFGLRHFRTVGFGATRDVSTRDRDLQPIPDPDAGVRGVTPTQFCFRATCERDPVVRSSGHPGTEVPM